LPLVVEELCEPPHDCTPLLFKPPAGYGLC
jgi:hypothetical protein